MILPPDPVSAPTTPCTPTLGPFPPFSPSPPSRVGQLLAGRLLLTATLGVGAYGVVYAARDRPTGARYAVKALEKAGRDARQRALQQREIQLHHRAAAHPNVCALRKILDHPDCTYCVLDRCGGGDLFAAITERGEYVGDDARARQAFLQILDAVAHCHARGIYHRDLKPENILLAADGGLRLADFGLATTEPVSADFGCGSTFYMSPECQAGGAGPGGVYLSAPNDVWSLGVILVNLTCGRNPWKRASAADPTFRAYCRDPAGFLPSILPLSAECHAILRRVFDPDPRTRIGLAELRQRVLACGSLTLQALTLPAQALTLPARTCGSLTLPATALPPPADYAALVEHVLDPGLHPVPDADHPVPDGADPWGEASPASRSSGSVFSATTAGTEGTEGTDETDAEYPSVYTEGAVYTQDAYGDPYGGVYTHDPCPPYTHDPYTHDPYGGDTHDPYTHDPYPGGLPHAYGSACGSVCDLWPALHLAGLGPVCAPA